MKLPVLMANILPSNWHPSSDNIGDSMRKFAINKICLNELSFEEAVDAAARAGFEGFTPWYDDISHLTPTRARSIIADAGLEISGFCNCGLFAAVGREKRESSIDNAKRNIDYAAEIGSPSIVTVVGGLLPDSRDLEVASEYAYECISEVLEYSRKTPVTLALEALHPMYTADWSVVSSLKQANEWCDRLGEGIGLTIDTYHCWWDLTISAEIERAGKQNRIAAYHVSDWLVPTNHILLDRGMPGNGVIDLGSFDQKIMKQGYDGPVEIEIFSETLWKQDPDEFLTKLRGRCDSIYL
jgi:sugar phosphate isomerase/epimerase